MSECSHEHERGAVCGNCGHRLGYLLYESEQAIAFERALSDSLMKINDELKARIAELEAALVDIREAMPGTDDAADRVQRIISTALQNHPNA